MPVCPSCNFVFILYWYKFLRSLYVIYNPYWFHFTIFLKASTLTYSPLQYSCIWTLLYAIVIPMHHSHVIQLRYKWLGSIRHSNVPHLLLVLIEVCSPSLHYLPQWIQVDMIRSHSGSVGHLLNQYGFHSICPQKLHFKYST